MKNEISPAVSAILDGLNEAVLDAQGSSVTGLRKTVIQTVKPKEILEELNMSQQEFSKAYGIPLATLRNWEQGRRKLDTTAIAYLKAICAFQKKLWLHKKQIYL